MVFIFLHVLVFASYVPRVDAVRDATTEPVVDDPCKDVMEITGLKTVRACVDQVTITAKDIYHTLMHLEHGVVGSYGFEHIARDSTAVVPELAGGCKLPIHAVKVPLIERLAEIGVWALQQLGIDQASTKAWPGNLHQLVEDSKKNKTIQALPFHNVLSKLFSDLHDSHTTYVHPIATVFRGFAFYTEEACEESDEDDSETDTSEQPRLQLKVRSDNGVPTVTARVIQGLASMPWCKRKWQDINAIEGQEPFKWLRTMADDLVGLVKSKGARLNNLLNSFGLAEDFSLETTLLPSYNSIRISWLNGTNETFFVGLNRERWGPRTMEEMQKAFGTNQAWDLIQNFMDGHLRLFSGSERDTAMEKVRSIASELEADTARDIKEVPANSNNDVLAGDTTSSLSQHLAESGVIEVGQVFDLNEQQKTVQRRAPVVAAYALPSLKTAVLKVTTMLPAVVDKEALESDFMSEVFTLYRKMVDTLSNAENAERLILDLTDNGGGALVYAYLLIALIAPRLATQQGKICNHYAYKMRGFWREWLKSFGGRWDDLISQLKTMPLETVKDRIRQLEDLGMLAKVIPGVPIDIGRIVRHMTAAMEKPTEPEQRHMLVEILESKEKFFTDDLAMKKLLGASSEYGWFPFTGDVRDPQTSEPFQPDPMSPYTDTQRRMWGQEQGEYTQRFQMECTWPDNEDLDFTKWSQGESRASQALHQWKEIAVLTNGLCGSACSLVATKLQFAAGATVFTYGGIPGEAMDHSAFAGGNVEDFAGFWPNVVYAGLIGDILYGSHTPIGARLRAPGAKEGHYADVLPLPLPTAARTRFNFAMMFEPEFGEDALPREWYLLPAHKNYDDTWLATSTRDARTWKPLKALYKRIANEDWNNVRQSFRNSKIAQDYSVDYSCANDGVS